jgi:phage host-nuclease inhibitor protein Gam
MKITGWDDVDKALLEIGHAQRAMAVDAAESDEEIAQIKAALAKRTERAKAVRDGYLAAVEIFVREHEGELVGRTWKGVHGKVWLRKVSFVTARSWKRVLDWLLERRKMDYVRVKYEVNKESLGGAPEALLKACGARIKHEDAFGYDLDEVVPR